MKRLFVPFWVIADTKCLIENEIVSFPRYSFPQMLCKYRIALVINCCIFFPTATLRFVNTFERIAQFGLVVAPNEMQDNQQEIPAEVDMWNVIMSFKDSFRVLFRYVKNKLNATVEDIELGSLSITVRCSSLKILEGLWEDYISGHLNQVVQEALVTHEVLEILGLDDLKLKVFISEEEYEKGKKVFADNSGERGDFLYFFTTRLLSLELS